jgi:hypothetical protein
MKNKLYYLGLVCCFLILAGCLFKIYHLPRAGIVLTVAFSTLCLWFIPQALMSSYRAENDTKVKWLYLIGFACIFVELGVTLFQIQHWPGGGVLLIAGIIASFLFLPTYLSYNRIESQVNYRNFMGVLFFFAYYAVITALLSINVSKNILDASIIASCKLEVQFKITDAQCKAMISGSNGSATLGDITSKTNALYKTLDSLKRAVAFPEDKDRPTTEPATEINLWEISGKDEKNIGTYWFVNSPNGKRLKKAVEQYRNFLLSHLRKDENESAAYINELLNTASKDEQDWTSWRFSGKNLINTITTLELLKRDVSLAAYETMEGL